MEAAGAANGPRFERPRSTLPRRAPFSTMKRLETAAANPRRLSVPPVSPVQTGPPMEPQVLSKPGRRRLQFGLRTLLLATTLFGIWLGVHMKQVRRQKQAVQAVRAFGGWVGYDYQEKATPTGLAYDSEIEPPVPKQLVDRLGLDFFFDVVLVNLAYSAAGRGEDHSEVATAVLPQLEGLPKFRRLYLCKSHATDDDLRIVGELTSLTHLYAWDAARVTDAGVSHLSGLANLQTLHLSYSQIGDESLRVLSKLPRLQELAAPGSRFTDRGLAYLKDATGLEQLSVGNARKITDAGMIHLGRLTNLTSLDLENAEITDHGLEQLTGLAKLKWIFLSGVNASGTEFRKAVPGCSVLR